MKDRIEFFLFLSLSFIVRTLGLGTSRKLSLLLTVFFYFIIPIRKKTVINNLRLAFPEYDDPKIRKIAFKSYRSFLITFVEILYFPSIDQEKLKSLVNSPNKELIINKNAEGNGLILVSAHFGNWEYLASSVSLQVNLPFKIIVKKQSNHYVSDWMDTLRTKFINGVVPIGVSIRNIYTELKGKNIIAMLADQRGPIDGIKINFFGRTTSVFSGPAILSLKSGAPIVFGIAIRQNDFSYTVHLEEISKHDLSDDKDGNIKELCQRYFAILEKYIRQYPEQWFWMHKRWKH